MSKRNRRTSPIDDLFIWLMALIGSLFPKVHIKTTQRGLRIGGSILFSLGVALLLLAMLIFPTRAEIWLLPVLVLSTPGLAMLLVWLKNFSEETAQSVTRAGARERLEEREMQEELHRDGYDLAKIERKISSGESFHVADDGEIAFDEKPAHKRARHNS